MGSSLAAEDPFATAPRKDRATAATACGAPLLQLPPEAGASPAASAAAVVTGAPEDLVAVRVCSVLVEATDELLQKASRAAPAPGHHAELQDEASAALECFRKKACKAHRLMAQTAWDALLDELHREQQGQL